MDKSRETYRTSLVFELYMLDKRDKIKLKNKALQDEITLTNFMRKTVGAMIFFSSILIAKQYHKVANNKYKLFNSFGVGLGLYICNTMVYYSACFYAFNQKYKNIAFEHEHEIIQNPKMIDKSVFQELSENLELTVNQSVKKDESSIDSQSYKFRESDMEKRGSDQVSGFDSFYKNEIRNKPDENFYSDSSDNSFFSEKDFKPAKTDKDFDTTSSEEASNNKEFKKPVRRTFIKYQQNPDSYS